jgi:hypothetical protein
MAQAMNENGGKAQSHLIYRNVDRSALSQCRERDGQACYMVRPIGSESKARRAYTVEFDDGVRLTAFADELFIP